MQWQNMMIPNQCVEVYSIIDKILVICPEPNLKHRLLLIVHSPVDRDGARFFMNGEDSLWLLIQSFPKEIKVYSIVPLDIYLQHNTKHFTVGFQGPETCIGRLYTLMMKKHDLHYIWIEVIKIGEKWLQVSK